MEIILKNKCRVCNEIKTDIDLENIFSEINLNNTNETTSWNRIIRNYCKIEILKTDLLPQNICSACKKSLLNAVYIIKLCQKSDQIFRALLNDSIKIKHNLENSNKNNLVDEIIESYPSGISNYSEDLINKPLKINENIRNGCEIKSHQCNQCKKNFKLKSHLTRHKQNVHEELKRHNCKECKKSFSGFTQFKIHMMKHNKEYPFLCSYCGKRFTQQYSLKVHQKIHSGLKDFKCSYCNYMSGNRGSLEMHIKGVHNVDKKHQCSDCGTRFMYPSGLAHHKKIHSGVKTHQCSICKKMFRTISNLKEHKRIHSGEKPYKCRHCEKTFKITGHRMVHERIHTGEKPYTCTVCEKKFHTKSNLNCHQKIHEKVL